MIEESDAILLTSAVNVNYLTGFESSMACVLLTHFERVYFTDARYLSEAKKSISGYKIEEVKASELYNHVAKYVDLYRIKKIGFEESVAYTEFIKMKSAIHAELVPIGSKMDFIRSIKSSKEIESISKANRIAEKAFSDILGLLKEGVSEKEMQIEFDYRIRKYGAEKTSFDTIIAFGENAAVPHHKAGVRKLKNGDVVLADFGAVYGNYCSDMTRSVFFGEPTQDMKMAYETVLQAHNAAICILKDGVHAKDVDCAARSIIENSKFKGTFLHSTGHGVGIEIHEMPVLSEKSNDILYENMVVTVEPGIYVENEFGIRIEDMIQIGKNESHSLASFDKNMIII